MSILSTEEIHRLEMKIRTLETMTSAEFKIIICKKTWMGIRRKASQLFRKYELDKTQESNAVLLLIVEKNQKLLIYGDSGIDEKSRIDHWNSVRDGILREFSKDNYYAGLSIGIEMIGANLIELFPSGTNNQNEVSNEIVFI